MEQTFSEQLSMWRTSNGVATMKQVLEQCKTVVKRDGVNFEIIRPHAMIRTDNTKILALYVAHKIEQSKAVERYNKALKSGVNDVEKLKKDLRSISRQMFGTIRQVTGYEHFMAVDDNAIVVNEDGKKMLQIHLFPMKADDKIVANFEVVSFSNEEGKTVELPCMVIRKKINKWKKKKGRNKK